MAVRASIKAWNTRCIFSNDLIHLVNTRRAFWLQIRASRGYYLFLMVVLVLCWCCAIMEIVSLNFIISGRNSYYKSQSPMTVSPLSLSTMNSAVTWMNNKSGKFYSFRPPSSCDTQTGEVSLNLKSPVFRYFTGCRQQLRYKSMLHVKAYCSLSCWNTNMREKFKVSIVSDKFHQTM